MQIKLIYFNQEFSVYNLILFKIIPTLPAKFATSSLLVKNPAILNKSKYDSFDKIQQRKQVSSRTLLGWHCLTDDQFTAAEITQPSNVVQSTKSENDTAPAKELLSHKTQLH